MSFNQFLPPRYGSGGVTSRRQGRWAGWLALASCLLALLVVAPAQASAGTGVISVATTLPPDVADLTLSVRVFKVNDGQWEVAGVKAGSASSVLAIEGLEPGAYRLAFEHRTYAPNPARIEPGHFPNAARIQDGRDIVVTAGKTTPVALAPLRSAAISGRVVFPAGTTSKDKQATAEVERWSGAMWESHNANPVSASGGFKVGGLTSGYYRLVVHFESDEIASTWFPSEAASSLAAGFRVERGRDVSGLVVTGRRTGVASGTFSFRSELPVTGFAVKAFRRAPRGGWAEAGSTGAIPMGRWAMRLAAGTYRFVPEVAGQVDSLLDLSYALDSLPDVVVKAGDESRVPTPVLPTGRVSGRFDVPPVPEPDGPAPYATVEHRISPEHPWVEFVGPLRPDGSWEVKNLPAGEVQFGGQGGTERIRRQLSDGEHLSGFVLVNRSVEQQSYRARVWLTGDSARFARSDSVEAFAYRRQADGTFESEPSHQSQVYSPFSTIKFEGIAPGTYRIAVRWDEDLTNSVSLPPDHVRPWEGWVGGDSLAGAADIVLGLDDLDARATEEDLPAFAVVGRAQPLQRSGLSLPSALMDVYSWKPAVAAAPKPSLRMAKSPKVTGRTKVGRTLSVSKGTWRSSVGAKVSVRFRWESKKGTKAVSLKNATKSKLKLTAKLRKRQVRVKVTVTAKGHPTKTYRTKWSKKVS